MGRTLRIVISVGLSAFFLYFAVRGVEWSQAFEALHRANYFLMVPVALVSIWTLIIRAQRWRIFLRPLGVPPLRSLVAATNIGFMANMVLPARVGEVIRPVLVSRREKLPIGGIVATVVLERIFDLVMVLLMFGVATLVVPIDPKFKDAGYGLTATAVAMIAVIVVLRWQEALALRLVRAVCDVLPKTIGRHAYDLIVGFVKALEILDSPMDFLRAFLWTMYLWAVIALANGFGLAAFHLPLESTLILSAIVAIAVALPSAPGYVGTFQLGCVAALTIFHVPEGDAIAFSIVHHLVQFFAVVAAGVYSLWTENMTFHDIEAAEEGDGAQA